MNSPEVKTREALAVAVEITDDALTVHLDDGRTITTPLAWYPRLVFATPEERNIYEILGRGEGIHWPELDEDLSVVGMLAGRPSQEGARSLKRWKEAMRRRRAHPNPGRWETVMPPASEDSASPDEP